MLVPRPNLSRVWWTWAESLGFRWTFSMRQSDCRSAISAVVMSQLPGTCATAHCACSMYYGALHNHASELCKCWSITKLLRVLHFSAEYKKCKLYITLQAKKYLLYRCRNGRGRAEWQVVPPPTPTISPVTVIITQSNFVCTYIGGDIAFVGMSFKVIF